MPGFWPGHPGEFQCHLMRLEILGEEVESEAGWGRNQEFLLGYKVRGAHLTYELKFQAGRWIYSSGAQDAVLTIQCGG